MAISRHKNARITHNRPVPFMEGGLCMTNKNDNFKLAAYSLPNSLEDIMR